MELPASRYLGLFLLLVLSQLVGRAFVSDHYGIFYILTINGQNPIPASVAREAGVYVNAVATENWGAFSRLYGHKVPK